MLAVCRCPECDLTFSVPAERFEELDSAVCPACANDVPVQEVEAVDPDEDEEEELTPVTRKRR